MLKSEQEIEETNRKSSDNNCTSNKKENICKKKEKLSKFQLKLKIYPSICKIKSIKN